MEGVILNRQLKSANQAFKDAKWHEAALLYEQVYQLEKSAKVNHLLVKSLYEDQQYKLAYQVMLDDPNSYLMDQSHLVLMVKVMLATNQLMMAHILMASLPQVPEEVTTLITASEQQFRQRPDFQTRYQAFYQLSSQTTLQQQRAFEEGKQLPLSEWLTAARSLLTDPFVKPIVRVSVLEMLVKLKRSERYDFRWLDDQNYSLNPNQLVPLADMPIVSQLHASLAEVINTDDPVTFQLYQNELGLQTTLLYPFVDRAIQSPDLWVNRLVHGDLVQSAQLPERYTLEWWHRKLAQVIANMTTV
ncbi:hypothetical protein FD04_GL001218 [Secundilactobacillus odoratitofui DSM 19909 = JCM 15043]|uniref:TPR repeat-containing protein n=1 Tax=Secundilactobacillus odoratitofui DSM 19909 = JCM 15043 TaxID=1423776 RepID=A0A0R1LR15_9LACO|nr:hypothetical protein FD04_GL001218 [Secundilactobacillus odoratitofui DSM 19909 = JCM 15043]